MVDVIEHSGRRPRRPPTPWAKKRRRLLKVLAVLAVLVVPALIWRAGVSRETRDLLRAQEAAGHPVTLDQLNSKTPAIAANENAAVLYQEALSLYRDVPAGQVDSLPFAGTGACLPGSELSGPAREATSAWLSLNGGTLEKMRAAAALPASRYLDTYRPSGYNDLSVIKRLDPLLDLACAEAVFQADKGDTEATIRALCGALAVARSVESEGVFFTLKLQWAMEEQVLSALCYAWSRTPLPGESLVPFSEQFTPERRLEQLKRMTMVEQCLFLARVREGYRRGLARNVLIASGVGDLNVGVYLDLMDAVRAWLGAPLAQQSAIEERFNMAMNSAEKRPLLFLTLHISRVPGYWDFYRKALDQAALARVALAVYNYERSHGSFPGELSALLPDLEASALILPSTGEPIGYIHDMGRAEVHNGGLGKPATVKSVTSRVEIPEINERERLNFEIVLPTLSSSRSPEVKP